MTRPQDYFDHASTSFPKSPAVIAAVADYLAHEAGNAGRGAYRLAVRAAARVAAARTAVATVFGHPDPERVVFTLNTTEALNLALYGSLKSGDHVVTTTIEHNAMARPLRRLAEVGVETTWVPATPDGWVDPAAIAAACRPDTRLVAVTAGSNVLGARVDVAGIRAAIGPVPLLLVDAAQVLGAEPVDLAAWGADLVAAPGHKAVGGPPGVGMLLVSARVGLRPWREGGTGSHSEAATTPALFPDGYEAGTLNGPGIAGLQAALDELAATDLKALSDHKHAVWMRLAEGLTARRDVEVFSCLDPHRALPLLAFRSTRLGPNAIAHALDRDHGIAVRAGLHCAPDAHRTAGSLNTGLVRLSIGPRHTLDDAARFLRALDAVLAAA